MSETYHAAVIGAGIVGVSTALHLLTRGMKVALIDRRGVAQETSYGNSGIINTSLILPFGFPPLAHIPAILLGRDLEAHVHYRSLPRYLPWLLRFYINSRPEPRRRIGQALWPLIKRSLDEHRVLMRDTYAEKYLSAHGGVTLYRNDKSFAADAGYFETVRRAGIPIETMEPNEFAALEPHVKPVYRKVIRWTANRHISNPGALTAAYADRFTRGGGTFMRAEVQNLEFSDNIWRVKSESGEISAANAVICAGPWSNEVLKPLGYNFPLAFKRGYHQTYAPAPGATLSHYIYDADYSFVLAPMEQGYRLTTGAEIAELGAPKTPVQLARTLPHARELFPLGKALEAEPWMGNRPCFADSLPVIGQSSRHRGLWFNFGHGHQGLTLGPVSGRLLAEMMHNEPPLCDPHPFRAERFS
jgi:D-amino-acid dehydrogenase